MTKKILIISQLGWPPEFGAQILRLSKIAKYLPLYGVEPIIVSPPPHSASLMDGYLFKDISKHGGKIYYVGRQMHPHLKRAKLARLLKFSLLPDLNTYFILYIKKIIEIIRRENIRYIFTSTPPSGLVLGLMLKERMGDKITWIADFADPWTLNHFYFSPTPLHRKFDERLERKIISAADAITFASEFQMRRYFLKYPDLKMEEKTHWLPNGYDEEDFKNIEPMKFDKFTFLHMGSIYREFDLSFLKIFKKLEKAGFDLKLFFIGSIAPKKREEIQRWNLKSVEIVGRLQEHVDVIKYLISADALIFNMKYDYIDVLPSRLPEYLRAGKPILAFTSRDSYVAQIISQCNAGYVIEKSEFEQGYEVARSLVKERTKIYPDWKCVEGFSWKNISRRLAILLGAPYE